MRELSNRDTAIFPPPIAGPGRGRVLVIADGDSTRNRLCSALRVGGYHVVQARDAAEGWRLLCTSPCDLVLLALVLPQLDWQQFRVDQLNTPALADIPLVIVTARPLVGPEARALRPHTIIHKPFADEALISVVARFCPAPSPAVVPPSPRAEPPAREAEETGLFWSRRGDVACAAHAPALDSGEWLSGRWAPIPRDAIRHRIVYQCQHCSRSGPIRHRTLAELVTLDDTE